MRAGFRDGPEEWRRDTAPRQHDPREIHSRIGVPAEPGRQVGTVGYMKAEPGAPNVLPGRVEFPVELRDLDAGTIERMWEHIQRYGAR